MNFLLDEHVYPVLRRELLRRAPDLAVWKVGEPGTVPLSTPDPAILEWCEVNSCLLVTNNRASMPNHMRDHLAKGRHVPGIILLDSELNIGEILDGLLLMHGASFPDEYQDTFVHLKELTDRL